MQFSTLTKFGFLSSLLATSLVIAQETPSGEQSKANTDQLVGGYNASCRIDINRPYDIFISGSFTYWQPIQENMELGVVSKNSNSSDLVHGKLVDLDNEFKPGFKVGIGMNFDYDKWQTFIQYTWFRGTEHVHRHLNSSNTQHVLLPAWQIPNFLNPQYSSGSEKWKLRMDLIDWDLARGYQVGTKLCFRPFIGLRLAFIDQKVHIKYKNTNPAQLSVWPSTSISQESDSWGIGPRIGLTSEWGFSKGWRIYNDAEVDILFTEYDLKSKQSSAVTTANRYIVHKDDADYLRAHAEINLGLGWGTYFSKNHYHINFSADYGFQVFFDQNMFRSTAATFAVGKGTLPTGNLYIQGLTVTARFDF